MRKGRSLLINIFVILVMLLVSRGGSNFTDFDEDNISVVDGVSECERLCWECCRKETVGICDYIPTQEKCGCPC